MSVSPINHDNRLFTQLYSKRTMDAMTKVMANKLGGNDIRVNTVDLAPYIAITGIGLF